MSADPEPFSPELIARLAQALAEKGLRRLEIDTGATALTLVVEPVGLGVAAAPSPPHAPAPSVASPPATTIPSRGIGRVAFNGPGAGWMVSGPGQPVAASEIVAFLRADELMLPVCSPVAGRLVRRLVPEGALVGYGQPVAEVLPDDRQAGRPSRPG